MDILNAALTNGVPAVEAASTEADDHGVQPASSFQTSWRTSAIRAASQHPNTGRADIAPRADRRLCPVRQPEENRLRERSQIFYLMGEFKLYCMKVAYDEIMTTAIKRQHEPKRYWIKGIRHRVAERSAKSVLSGLAGRRRLCETANDARSDPGAAKGLYALGKRSSSLADHP